MDSILTSVKKQVGITEEDTSFDADIIMHINSVFMILTQLGVGPTKGFFITDKNDLWDDYMSPNQNLEAIKTYMGCKVRLIFDPPMSSAVLESLNKIINEFEFRIHVSVDPAKESEG